MRQVAFIRQQKLGFQTLEAAEFEELRPLLVKVEQAQGNRDFAAFLQQGNPADAFFKASCRFVNVNSTSLSSCCPNIHLLCHDVRMGKTVMQQQEACPAHWLVHGSVR